MAATMLTLTSGSAVPPAPTSISPSAFAVPFGTKVYTFVPIVMVSPAVGLVSIVKVPAEAVDTAVISTAIVPVVND